MPDGSVAVTAKFGRKRDTIVAVATELLNHEGVKGMTLAKVAGQVGLITTSVTYYFRRKEDLAAACFLRGIERIEAVVSQAQGGASPEERLSTLLDRYLALKARVRRGEEPAIPVFSDVRALTDEPHMIVRDAYLRLFRGIRDLLRGTPDHDGAHGTAFTQMVLEQLHWLQAWLHHYPEDAFDDVRERMLDILVRGLAAPGRAWSPWPLDADRVNPAEGGQRETFLLAATRLINQQGYRGASVDKISASLNVTKGSFYHHHSAKDDVVVSCFARSFQVVRSAQDAAVEAPGADAWDRLSSAAAALMVFQLSPHGPLLRTSALSALPEGMRGEMIGESNLVSERWAATIAAGAAEGSLRPVDPFIAAQMLAAGLNASSDLPVFLGGVTARELVDLYARPMLMGLRPD